MRSARVLLLFCLAAGLLAVWWAARVHLAALRASVEKAELAALRSELKERGRALCADLPARLRAAPVAATYDRAGALLRPAPPRTAAPWRGGALTLPADRAALDLVAADAPTRLARAQALLRKGYQERSPEAYEEALPTLAGSDLAYRVRLEVFRLRGAPPDAAWVDDVSALLGGPSDRYARWLLAEAGAEPVDTRADRASLAALHPVPGLSFHAGHVALVEEEGDHLVLRRLPLAALALGEGDVAEPLPPPLDALAVRGALADEALGARLADERLRNGGLYLLAGLLLTLGTAYAYVAIARAHRLARQKSDFVANITHELKTPLANIRLYGESLRDGRVREPDRAAFLATLLEEAGRLDQLVEGLLHAARGPRLARERLDPRALLAEAEARWRPRLEREGFAFEVDAPELPVVAGDREALLRALDNLLDNARKYAGAGKRITLQGAARDGAVRFTVRDRGPGIPAGSRAHVLEPFARLEGGDRKETPGAGLGLSLVHACMEAHAGAVEIASGEGGAGAAVTLVLPVEAE